MNPSEPSTALPGFGRTFLDTRLVVSGLPRVSDLAKPSYPQLPSLQNHHSLDILRSLCLRSLRCRLLRVYLLSVLIESDSGRRSSIAATFSGADTAKGSD